jgi:hypothetical protein
MIQHYPNVAVLLLFMAIAGCGDAPAGPPLVPAEGVITFNGSPLAAADLIFVPQGETKGQGGVGRTDSSGRFKLISHDRKHDGIPAGSYRVVINKLVKPDGTDFVPDRNAGPMDTGGFREVLPPTYSDMGLTTLQATIPVEGTKDLNFKLTKSGRGS